MANPTADPRPPALPAGVPSRPPRGEPEIARVDPELLMTEVNRPRMARMLAIAAVFHAALIGLTSITYISLSLKYHTLHPKWKIKAIEKEKVEKQEAENLAKATEEARKKASERGGAVRKGAGGKESVEPGSESRSGGEPDRKPGDKKSSIEKAVTETSTERPKDSSLNLDDALR